MRIGCVIPVYNRSIVVREALDSIASQARQPDAVVVADDASTDHTATSVAGWLDAQARGPGWRLLRLSENGGPARARTRAIDELADCDILAFLDSDDLWPTDYLERVAQAFADRPDAVASVSDHARERPRRDVHAVVRDQRLVAASPMWGVVRRGAPPPSSVAVRRRALMRAGGFGESLRCAEDVSFYLHLAMVGAWIHLPGAPIRYRIGAAAQRGETPPLTQSVCQMDQMFQTAAVVERFCRESRPAKARAMCALTWFRAGAASFHVADWAACRRACACALRFQPWHARAMWRWVCATTAAALGLGRKGAGPGTGPRSPAPGIDHRPTSGTSD